MIMMRRMTMNIHISQLYTADTYVLTTFLTYKKVRIEIKVVQV